MTPFLATKHSTSVVDSVRMLNTLAEICGLPVHRRCMDEVAFAKLTHEVSADVHANSRWTPAAISALAIIMEATMTCQLRTAARLARYYTGWLQTAEEVKRDKQAEQAKDKAKAAKVVESAGLDFSAIADDLSKDVTEAPARAIEATLLKMLRSQSDRCLPVSAAAATAKSAAAAAVAGPEPKSAAEVEELMGLAIVMPKQLQLARRLLQMTY